jgi:hypothetical protein
MGMPLRVGITIRIPLTDRYIAQHRSMLERRAGESSLRARSSRGSKHRE